MSSGEEKWEREREKEREREREDGKSSNSDEAPRDVTWLRRYVLFMLMCTCPYL